MLSPNTITAAVGFWAVVMCGAVVVMISPRTPAHKLAWVLKDADAAALITDGSLIGVAVAAGLTNVGAVIVAGPPLRARRPVPRRPLSNAGCRHRRGLTRRRRPRLPARTDLAALVYTSGSSGEPKAVMVTHGNVDAAATAICGYLGLTCRDVLLCALPLSFDYGLYQMIMSVKVGARSVLERSFDLPGQFLTRSSVRE